MEFLRGLQRPALSPDLWVGSWLESSPWCGDPPAPGVHVLPPFPDILASGLFCLLLALWQWVLVDPRLLCCHQLLTPKLLSQSTL